MVDETEVPGYFTLAEAARYLGVHIQTLKHHLKYQQDLAPDARPGGVLLFRQETLDEFQKRRVPAGRPRRAQSE